MLGRGVCPGLSERFGAVPDATFHILLGNSLLSNTCLNRIGVWNSGIPQQRTERGRLDVVLDKLNDNFAELVKTVETGGLDQFSAAEKISWWRRFETFRNRLPLIDHSLIAEAEATDLPATACSSGLSRFLVQVLQLSPR